MSDEDLNTADGSCCCCGGGWAKWIGAGVAVILVVLLLGWLAGRGASPCGGGTCALPVAPAASNPPSRAAADTAFVSVSNAPAAEKLPRLVDLGANKCIPCKMMAPILEDLKKTYAGKLDVQFIDVWEKPEEGPRFGIRIIPTQIFFDAAGKELFRHEGFLGKDDILAKWKEFGVDLASR